MSPSKAPVLLPPSETEKPLATFGLITDIQYADVDDGFNYSMTRQRFYRQSLELTRQAVEHWRKAELGSQKFKFLIQLGDLIDYKASLTKDSHRAMARVLGELDALGVPVLHIWGNHDMYNFTRANIVRTPLNTAAKLAEPHASVGNFYGLDVVPGKLRLLCLDFYELSVLGYEDDPKSAMLEEAWQILRENRPDVTKETVNVMGHILGPTRRFAGFNGALSARQLAWLESQLHECDKAGVKAIVCGHLPVHVGACYESDAMCLAWNHQDVLDVLWRHAPHTVIAYFAGHDHLGGHDVDERGIAHFTFDAVLEMQKDTNCYVTVKFYEHRLVVESASPVMGRHEVTF